MVDGVEAYIDDVFLKNGDQPFLIPCIPNGIVVSLISNLLYIFAYVYARRTKESYFSSKNVNSL